MTIAKTYVPRRLAIPAAAMAGLLLAGCSSGNIGESWQCPLAETGSCDSVAAADPAVPDMGAARKTLLTEPLWRQRAGEPRPPALPAREPAPDAIRGPGQAAEPSCEAACGGGFDPFGWLMRLFGAGGEDGPMAKAKSPAAAVAAPLPETGPERARPATAALPAEPASVEDDPGGDGLRGDGLRTGEVVARIWIAPFVDADGVYREASHVRIVLEPAGWRLPR